MDKLILRERGLRLAGLYGGGDLQDMFKPSPRRRIPNSYLLRRVFVLDHFCELLDQGIFECSVLLLEPPFGDLREPSRSEMFLEVLALALVWGEESEQVFDAALFENCGQMVHG